MRTARDPWGWKGPTLAPPNADQERALDPRECGMTAASDTSGAGRPGTSGAAGRVVMKAILSALSLLLLFVAGCSVASEEDVGTNEAKSVEGRTPVVLVTDPEALGYLEQNGFSFAERFSELAAGNGSGEAIDRESPRYRALEDFVRADMSTVLEDYSTAVPRKPLPTIGDGANSGVEKGLRYHAFNADWLESASARFELIAVSNRIDRRGVPARTATCGEQRLVYRLAYSGNREDSRLPFTVVVTFPQRASASCQAAAEHWLMSGPVLTGAALGKWLADKPLRALAKPIAFELNFQADAWSRFVRGADGVGRHHQYSLRVFEPTAAGGLAPVPSRTRRTSRWSIAPTVTPRRSRRCSARSRRTSRRSTRGARSSHCRMAPRSAPRA